MTTAKCPPQIERNLASLTTLSLFLFVRLLVTLAVLHFFFIEKTKPAEYGVLTFLVSGSEITLRCTKDFVHLLESEAYRYDHCQYTTGFKKSEFIDP